MQEFSTPGQSVGDEIGESVGLAFGTSETVEPVTDLEAGVKNTPEQTEIMNRLVEEKLTVLQKEADRRKRGKPRMYAVVIFGITCVAALTLASMSGWARLFPGRIWNFWWIAASLIGGLRAMTSAQKQAAVSLAQLDDIRAIGPMCEILGLESKTGEIRVVEAYLIRNLPLLRANDAHQITADQLEGLHIYISKDTAHHDNQVLVILEALKQIGNARSRVVVHKIAHGPSLFMSRRVQTAALECLPYLEAIETREEEANTLLRGSSGVDSAPDTLLRAADGSATTTNPELLLRASSPELQPVNETIR